MSAVNHARQVSHSAAGYACVLSLGLGPWVVSAIERFRHRVRIAGLEQVACGFRGVPVSTQGVWYGFGWGLGLAPASSSGLQVGVLVGQEDQRLGLFQVGIQGLSRSELGPGSSLDHFHHCITPPYLGGQAAFGL